MTGPTIHTRSLPIDPKSQFILFIKPGIENHGLITHPNVTVLARCRPEAINIDKPPGFPDYFVHSTYYHLINAQNVGKRWADWFEYQGLSAQQDIGVNIGDYQYAGAIYCQNWGTSTWSPSSLMMEPNDQVNGYSVGYHEYGTRINQFYLPNAARSPGDFIKIALQTMKDECDSRKLCYPMYIAWDWEQLVGPNLVGLQTSGPGNAPWTAAINSSKYTTEVVYEEWDGVQWIGKTLYDAYVEAGSPTTDPSVWWFQGANRQFVCKMMPYYLRINDHALAKTLYEPAKEIFPEILCANYGITSNLSAVQSEQAWEVQNNFFRYPKTNFNPGRYLRADYSMPVCYSPNMLTGNPARYNPAYNVSYPAPEFSGHIFGTTKQEVYRNYIVQNIRSCTVNNSIPCMPNIESPFEGASSGDFPETHIPDETDIQYVLQQSYNLGCKTWNVFNPSHSNPNNKTNMDALLSTINDFNSWTKTQNRTFRIRGVS